MLLLYPTIAFLFGASIGSFLNVVILRSMSGTSLGGRSQCPHCDRTLKWYELIPIFSFILQRGQCRACRNPISLQYPLVELTTGLAALILFTQLSRTPLYTYEVYKGVLLLFCIACILIILFVIDLKTFLLPDFFIILLTVITLLTPLYTYEVYKGGSALVGAGLVLLLWLGTRGQGIGLGDVKLMVPLGFLFGPWGSIAVLWVSFLAGGAFGAYLLITKKATGKTPIPFGPFLTGTALLFILFPSFKQQLTDWMSVIANL